MTLDSKGQCPAQGPGGGPNSTTIGSGVGQNPVLPPSRLFISSVLEQKDDLDERHDRCFSIVTSMMSDKSEKEAHEALSVAVSKDQKTHGEVCLGFLVAILSPQTDPELATRYFRDVTLVSRDGLQVVVSHLNHLVAEKYTKMLPGTKQQLMWLMRELIRANVVGVDGLCWFLMRQVAGGDVSRPNLWLAEILVDIYSEFRPWLEKYSFLVASVVYTYLRIIEDHVGPTYEKLREKEVKFVVSLIRDRFNDVMMIGRDFLRLLQYVARIPEFDQLWRDILYNPKALSPTFNGFVQLMHTRTSRRFLQSRVTSEMEKKLVFLTSQVRFGTHKRYQDWFQRQYLSTNESQSLRCDLIRFIVGVIHPTNELLCSDIIPRWAVIGWLLTTCTSQVAGSNARLALFYDWLFFEPDKDNIMNIEPAILVMHNSMRPHPAITATLLDFLCRIMANFHPRDREGVRNGIYNSLKMILDKRVLPSLAPLFDNPRLDKELRAMLRKSFAPFCGDPGEDKNGEEDELIINHDDDDEIPSGSSANDGETATPAQFSDEEDDGGGDGGEGAYSNHLPSSSSSVTNTASVNSFLERKKPRDHTDEDGDEDLEESLKEILNDFKNSKDDSERQCEIMDQLVKHIISESLDYEQTSHLASSLADLMSDQFEGRIFPDPNNPRSESDLEEQIEDSIGRPLFVIFRTLCEMTESDPHRIHLLQLLAELYTLQPRIGYYLLYFLNASNRRINRDSKSKANVYRDLCEAIDRKFSLDICLVNDMRQCQEDDVNLFVYLVPDIYRNFAKHSIGNVDLLYLVVSCVDGRQVQDLVCHVVAKDFTMFKKDSIGAVLQSSLGWETFEQYALWQLVTAHNLDLDCFLSLIPKLTPGKHCEALTSVLLLIKQEKPTTDVLKNLLSREVRFGDRFVTSALINWISGEYKDKVGDLVSSYLCKQALVSSGPKRKRGHQNGGSLPHAAELTLCHLDQLRMTMVNQYFEFFERRPIQSALQQVRHSCTDSQKKKFMDLFALADSDSEEDSQPLMKSKKTGAGSGSGSGGRSKGTPNKKGKKISESSGSSSESSEDEKPKGKRGGRKPGGASSGSRKRGANKISYKEVPSSDDSSDEDNVLSVAKQRTPKKRKKISPPSDSD